MITLIIIAITVIVTFLAFNNATILNNCIFYPYEMNGNNSKQFKFLSHGLIHADWMHLIFNMFTLHSFGSILEQYMNPVFYVLMYITAIIASALPSYFKHKNNYQYRALGASGAVSAVVFATIMIAPWQLNIMGLPGIIYAFVYLGISYYLSKKGNDNIGHDAHIYGSLYGWVFMYIFQPNIAKHFIEAILNYK
jgi:membrane associated rhomboid family serine protease